MAGARKRVYVHEGQMLDIIAKQGVEFDLDITIDSGGDLSSDDGYFKVAHPDTGVVLLELTAGSGLTFGVGGLISVTLTDEQMALPARPLPYDLVHLPNGGGQDPICKGYLIPEETVGYTLTGDIVPTIDYIPLTIASTAWNGTTLPTLVADVGMFDPDADEHVAFSTFVPGTWRRGQALDLRYFDQGGSGGDVVVEAHFEIERDGTLVISDTLTQTWTSIVGGEAHDLEIFPAGTDIEPGDLLHGYVGRLGSNVADTRTANVNLYGFHFPYSLV